MNCGKQVTCSHPLMSALLLSTNGVVAPELDATVEEAQEMLPLHPLIILFLG